MKILLSWLKEFVPFEKEPRELATDLSQLGLAVDSITTEDGEAVLEIDVTTNRPDCLSHYGIAREVAARYSLAVAPLTAPSHEAPKPRRVRRKDGIVEIAAADLCGRYSARLIRGVQVKPSPEWLSKRLEAVGVRSINNVADATNYVLMAYGHPMHAFDLDRLQGGRILVRRAMDGELFTTLDNVARKLSSDDLVIADAVRSVALAGVMGGLDTEISTDTRNVLLESAWFNPISIRRTSKRHGLHTEASHRFERGADIEATLVVAEKCIEMIRELAGGEIDTNFVDAYPTPQSRHPVLLHRWELQRHLGLEVPPDEVERILYSLGFLPHIKGRTGWTCTVPSYRVDISREVDLVEEVARHFGYDRLPMHLPATIGEATHDTPNAEKEERVRRALLALGYDETISMSLLSKSSASYGGAPIALENPLSEEAAFLRTSIVPGLLAALQRNVNRGQQNVRLCEIGRVFLPQSEGCREPSVATLVAVGDREAGGLTDSGNARAAAPVSFLDIKGDVEQLLDTFTDRPCIIASDGLPPYYRSGHAARFVLDGTTVAQFGEVSVSVAEEWKFRGSEERPVYIAELLLETLYALPPRQPRATPVSRYPAVERDFSVILRDETSFADVEQAVGSLGIADLAGIRPVEIFRGGSLDKGHYSLLLRVTLQSPAATLTEVELSAHSARIIQVLEGRLGAKIRMSK